MPNSILTGGGVSPAAHSPEQQWSEPVADEPKDTRVFMYRKGESRLFDSLDEVPRGEGWVDHPDKVADLSEPESPAPEPEPAAQARPKQQRKKPEPDQTP